MNKNVDKRILNHSHFNRMIFALLTFLSSIVGKWKQKQGSKKEKLIPGNCSLEFGPKTQIETIY